MSNFLYYLNSAMIQKRVFKIVVSFNCLSHYIEKANAERLSQTKCNRNAKLI